MSADKGVYGDLLGRKFRQAEESAEGSIRSSERITGSELGHRQRVVKMAVKAGVVDDLAHIHAGRPLKPPGR